VSTPILAWHFLADNRLMRDGYGPVEAGWTYMYDGLPIPCHQGLHASRRAIDALDFAPGAVICRVECAGRVVEGHNKLACTERTVLWMADATEALHLFACDEAELALTAREIRDERSWNAIRVKRDWVKGNASDSDLTAARAAARAAARDAARAAAWTAARAAAWTAAWTAANDRLTARLEALA
jgi:hypothetical protein